MSEDCQPKISGPARVPGGLEQSAIDEINSISAEFSSLPWTGEHPTAMAGAKRIPGALKALVIATRDKHKRDAQENGNTAKAFDEIDQHRKGAGKEGHNADRRLAYFEEKVELTGKPPRPYNRDQTADGRKAQKSLSKQKKLDQMTPDELMAYRAEMAANERVRRARKKAEAAAALVERAIV